MKKTLFLIVIALAATMVCQAQVLEKGDFTRVTSRSLRGVKGFFEAGYLWGVGDYNTESSVEEYKPSMFSISASAGCQFNNYIFVGMGIAADVYSSSKTTYVTAPIFMEGRINFLKVRRFTPFVDMRIGYGVGDMHGLYWACQIGVRRVLPKKRAVYLSYGCDYQINQDYRVLKADHVNCNLGLRLGFEL